MRSVVLLSSGAVAALVGHAADEVLALDGGAQLGEAGRADEERAGLDGALGPECLCHQIAAARGAAVAQKVVPARLHTVWSDPPW